MPVFNRLAKILTFLIVATAIFVWDSGLIYNSIIIGSANAKGHPWTLKKISEMHAFPPH